MEPAYVKVCSKRHTHDCLVCCLVMLLGVSYEAALLAISKVDPTLATTGLYFSQAKKAVKSLGFNLKAVRKGRYSLEESVGILRLDMPKTAHAVILLRGVIIDPEGGEIWDDPQAYFENSKVKQVGSLWVLQ